MKRNSQTYFIAGIICLTLGIICYYFSGKFGTMGIILGLWYLFAAFRSRK